MKRYFKGCGTVLSLAAVVALWFSHWQNIGVPLVLLLLVWFFFACTDVSDGD